MHARVVKIQQVVLLPPSTVTVYMYMQIIKAFRPKVISHSFFFFAAKIGIPFTKVLTLHVHVRIYGNVILGHSNCNYSLNSSHYPLNTIKLARDSYFYS